MNADFDETNTDYEHEQYIFDRNNPTINYHEFTLGDIFAMSAVLIVCCSPLLWCYFDHRDKIRAKISQESISDSDDREEFEASNGSNDDALLSENGHGIAQSIEMELQAACADDDDDEENIIHINKRKKAFRKKEFRRESISGPIRGSSRYTAFVVTLVGMIIAGSSNDFLGKLIYQMYPGNSGHLQGLYALKNEYWLTFLLTFGSFFVCTFALFAKSARQSFEKVNMKLFAKMAIPSILDTLVTGGRYLGLVFLSAALISILKNGSQLLFLALLRRGCHHKKLLCAEWFGIAIIIVGLLIVAMNKIYVSLTDDNNSDLTFQDSLIGIVIMISVGFAGAIRNDIEELLLKNDNLDSNFVVGLESAISLTVTMICGVILFIIDPFDNIQKQHMFQHIYRDILTQPMFIACFVLFLVAIYTKDTLQMKMTVLSSSLTRKLFQQIYPSGTWLISLTTFAINCVFFGDHDYAYDATHEDLHQYGESWQGKYSWIRLAGFAVVLIGNYFYIKGHSIFTKLTYKHSYA